MNNIKKFLPLILVLFGIVILVVVFIFIKNKNSATPSDSEDTVTEIAFKDRPVAMLTPTEDGRYINLKIEKITLPKVITLDYELLYSLPDGRTQGVPGNVELNGETSFERKLLLGSESNGKFRYDEGVEEGSLTIRLRDSKGKLLAKFSTKFHFQNSVAEVTSIDESFTYVFDKLPKGKYFIIMETFGLMDKNITAVESGPYGVFTSGVLPAGSAEGWQLVDSNIFYK